jgi:uncharacterized membrane protein YhaH (DUF805 family)
LSGIPDSHALAEILISCFLRIELVVPQIILTVMKTEDSKRSLNLDLLLTIAFILGYIAIYWSKFYAGILQGLKDF